MKKWTVFFLVLALVFSMAACTADSQDSTEASEEIRETSPAPTDNGTETSATESDPSLLARYGDLIFDYQNILKVRLENLSEYAEPELSSTLMQAKANIDAGDWETMIADLPLGTGTETTADYGYILHDLNGDGAPELFWVRSNGDIIALFTWYEEQVVLLETCHHSRSLYVGEDNGLYSYASDGHGHEETHLLVLRENTLETVFHFGADGENWWEAAEENLNLPRERFADLKTQFPAAHSSYWKAIPVQTLDTQTDLVNLTVEENKLPRLIQVPRPDMTVWKGPGYDYSPVTTVQEAGTYTIVAQVKDGEGYLWGCLKSGLGWIDLSLVEKEKENPPIISVNYPGEISVSKDNCHYCQVDDSEYAVRVAFRIYDSVTDVTFWSMVMEENFQKDEALFQMDSWEADKPLVVDVAFPGDMTMYAISFTDSQGNAHTYTIGISGRNGSLILKPFEDLKESQ